MTRSLSEIRAVVRDNTTSLNKKAPRVRPLDDPKRVESVKAFFGYFREKVNYVYRGLNEEEIGIHRKAIMGNEQGVGLIRSE